MVVLPPVRVPAPRGSLAHLKPHHCTVCCRTLLIDCSTNAFFFAVKHHKYFLRN